MASWSENMRHGQALIGAFLGTCNSKCEVVTNNILLCHWLYLSLWDLLGCGYLWQFPYVHAQCLYQLTEVFFLVEVGLPLNLWSSALQTCQLLLWNHTVHTLLLYGNCLSLGICGHLATAVAGNFLHLLPSPPLHWDMDHSVWDWSIWSVCSCLFYTEIWKGSWKSKCTASGASFHSRHTEL